MHPDVVQDTPGICVECGMQLVLKTTPDPEAAKKPGHGSTSLLQKFWLSLALTVPAVAYSSFVRDVIGFEAPAFTGSEYVPVVFGTIVFFYGGWVFLEAAWREIRGKLPGMMTLISLAILTAYSYSMYVVILGEGKELFWELTTLITIMLLGHWMEGRAVSGAQGALKKLSQLLPETAEVIDGKKSKKVPVSHLHVGDIVRIRPGGSIPADGEVVSGISEVNESMMTGESLPVPKEKGVMVIGGTVNQDGMLKVEVTSVGDKTFIAGVQRLIAEAQASKSKLQTITDKAALFLTVIAIGGALITFGAWLVADGTYGFALERAVAVLVIACPHALGLAVPLVAALSTTMAANRGFLIRNRIAMEQARKIDTVLFDKTGTLTEGRYGVQHVWAKDGKPGKGVLQKAAAVDQESEHAISKAVVEEATKRKIAIPPVKNFKRLPGKGVSGTVKGKSIIVGGESVLIDANMTLPHVLEEKIAKEHDQGKTIIYVLESGKFVGAIALADIIREESREAISKLVEMGVEVQMVTGDAEPVAKWVANESGIETYYASIFPRGKVAKVKELQKGGAVVAMVGDGINDAPSLAQADVGLAIGSGTNIAIESADILLVKNDPRDVVRVIELSRLTYRKMVENLFWAAGYNVVALPLAAGALAFAGVFLQPAVAALLMSISTVIVAVNAIMMRRQA